MEGDGKKQASPLFVFLDYVLKKKKVKHIELNGLFMVNRFLSMHSDQMTTIVNLTTNRWAKVKRMNSDMDLMGKYLFKVLPKTTKNAPYIKKQEKQEEEEQNIDDSDLIAITKNMNISTKEVEFYFATLDKLK